MRTVYCSNPDCGRAIRQVISSLFDPGLLLASPESCPKCHPENFAGAVISRRRRLFGRVEVRIHEYGYVAWHYFGRRKPFMLWLAIILSPNGVIQVADRPLKWNIYQSFYGDAAVALGLARSVKCE